MLSLQTIQSNDFIPYLNEAFCVRLEGIPPIDLQLVSVAPAGRRLGPMVRQPFSLQFLGPASPQYLPQHIYRLEHRSLGVLELFLVPLGPEQGRMRYEAIFA